MERKRILSIDGGGIRGIIPLCALVELERQMEAPASQFFSFFAGTSTGAIISGGLATGLTAEACLEVYTTLGERAFHSDPWGWLLSLGSFKYRTQPLVDLLKEYIPNPILNDVQPDILLPAMRVSDGKPFYFVKDNAVNEAMFGTLHLVDCIAASAAAPTFFEPWPVPKVGACVDGGVGIAGNPSYQACVEAFDYTPAGAYPKAETTIVSLGTGFFKTENNPGNLVEWVQWIVGELLDEPAEQQTMLIRRHYAPEGTHLVRLNVQMPQDIPMDDIGAIPRLVEIGMAAAKQLDWNALLLSPAGTRAALPSALPRNRTEKRAVIKLRRPRPASKAPARRRPGAP
jgi:hypothetical protein